jgi:hypothetical protein
MKIYFVSRVGKVMRSLAGMFLAGVISVSGTAQVVPNEVNSSAQQQAPRTQGEAPDALYHLIYTLTESDGAKRLGVQNFVLTVSSDREAAPSELKVGSRVPVVTGLKDSSNPQITYVDVGLTIQARIQRVFPGGLEVFSAVEQSSVAPSPDDKIVQPLIRSSNLRDVAVLYPNGSVSLGSFDVPGSTRHYEVLVTMKSIR